MTNPESRVNVIFECSAGHRHPLCLTVGRGVPQKLRCSTGQATGFGPGGGGCPTPPDIDARVEWELSRNLEESMRRGYVLIRA